MIKLEFNKPHIFRATSSEAILGALHGVPVEIKNCFVEVKKDFSFKPEDTIDYFVNDINVAQPGMRFVDGKVNNTKKIRLKGLYKYSFTLKTNQAEKIPDETVVQLAVEFK